LNGTAFVNNRTFKLCHVAFVEYRIVAYVKLCAVWCYYPCLCAVA
jgi:hypothetical protein